ncbi:MAG: radical SAM protein [Gammaproteobacteria bacterium]|nr:radical SAM protein [Gammaproteobacteria bacterium]
MSPVLPPRIAAWLANEEMARIYERVRSYRIIISGYDLTQRCNLRCEGCFFFEGDRSTGYADDLDADRWEAFFRSEQQRGISYPHLAGAEPAVVPDRLAAAAAVFDQGLVYTNGTIRIDPALPFMLHISVWGDDATDSRLRGGPVLAKALRLYRDDPRAIFMYTISAQNRGEIRAVVERVAHEGGRISFNHFSPTRLYRQKLAGNVADPLTPTYRLSSSENNLCLDDSDLVAIHDDIAELMQCFPESVIYSRYYNDQLARPGPFFKIRDGVATNCPILNRSDHRQYRSDLSFDDSECCIPNVDCSTCRHYVAGYSRLMGEMRDHLSSESEFRNWLELVDTWLRLHIRDYPRDGLAT